MRRRLHSVIVALLCLTLFVDTATACWYLRHHGRATACCDGGWSGPTAIWHGQSAPVILADRPLSAWVVVEGGVWADAGLELIDTPPTPCCVPCDGSAHAVVEATVAPVDVVEHGVEQESVVVHDRVERGDAGTAAPRTAPAEDVVVHDPTIVVGAGEQVAPAEPKTARPAAPQPQLAAREPLPDLQPATMPEPKERQPVPASLDLPADADADAEPMAKDDPQPMPTTPDVDDLAGGPRVAPPQVEPRPENWFDELADEAGDDDADGPAEGGAEMPAEEADDDDKAPGSADDPEMAEESATAATVVPDEPMRRWTDATGDHHAQGWLAELRPDEVRILKVNGRFTTMALADLSDEDQAYVASVAARLAASRHARTTDTAGL